jgi:hypothetical protein
MSHQNALQTMAMSHIFEVGHIYEEHYMEAIKFQLRLPADVKNWLESDAVRSDRSMNSQVVAILRERMKQQTEPQPAQTMN